MQVNSSVALVCIANTIAHLGAPQKVMWASLQRWREAALRDKINLSFITGEHFMPFDRLMLIKRSRNANHVQCTEVLSNPG